jgi:hypothetical protein
MSTATYDPPLTCSATRAFKSIFESPNWSSNLLWLTLACILHSLIVGQVFLFGYGAALLHARAGLPDRKNPDIDSNRLGDYFLLGLWPFLVYLIASLIASVLLVIPILMIVGIVVAMTSQWGDASAIVVAVIALPLVAIVSIAFVILLAPIAIRAMICQDFQKSFDVAWCVRFVQLTFRELVVSTIAFGVLAFAIYLAGAAMFCIGILPALGLLSGAAMHLMSQWYELFLSRGGEPVEPAANAIIDASVV